jgi:hypothetical protein
MIRTCSADFFAEMGEELLLIGEEVRQTDFVDDRIDLLAIDKEGSSVVIEIKRGSHKFHLLQALSYAAMVSKWSRDRIVTEYSSLVGKATEAATEDIEEFLNVDVETLNVSQRVLLLAENFDYEVLVTAEWLSEKFEMDIRCYRIGLSSDGTATFLTCTCIYPAPELVEHAIHRRGPCKASRWPDWETALTALGNDIVATFFRKELAAGRDNYLYRRVLRYRVNGKRTWAVIARKEHAYVWQEARFKDDVKYWARKVGDHAHVQPVKDGRALRFFLTSAKDFEKFLDAIQGELKSVEFQRSSHLDDLEPEE